MNRLPYLLYALVFLSGCASMKDMKALQADVVSLWDKLTIEVGRNDVQDIQLTRLERSVIQLSLADDLLFPLGSTKLEPESAIRISRVGTILRDFDKTKIRSEPNFESSIIEIDRNLMDPAIDPVEIKKNWMKIRYWQSDKESFGWIRWKEGNQMLITLWYLM